MSSKNIPNLIKERERNQRINRRVQTKLQVYGQLVKRLALDTELQGHQGCVNCLEWNPSGSLLSSGSDDLTAIIWDPHQRKLKHKINTGHSGNIFSVKFMPNTGDHVLATGAADSQVRVHSVSIQETMQIFKCHASRVKRLATSPDSPHLIWSASEDGTVRQFDLRESHSCQSTGEPCKNVLIDLKLHVTPMCEAKCIVVNPCQSELLAVGCNDPYVRLYDRRMLGKHCASENGEVHCSSLTCQKDTASLPTGCVKYFTPGHLTCASRRGKKRSLVVTYLTFGPNGRELLVNLGGEQLYLFDIRLHHSPLRYTTSSFADEGASSTFRNGIVHYDSTVCTAAETQTVHCNHANSTKTGLNGSTNGYTVTKVSSKKPQSLPGTSKISEDSNDLSGKALELKMKANEEFEGKNYWGAINLYNQALLVAPDSPILYANRAAAFLKRGWYGDIYAGLRDCHQALEMDSSNFKASYRQARCLFELQWFAEAEACLKQFKTRFPDECNSKIVKILERDIKAAVFSETEDGSPAACQDSSKRTDNPSNRRQRHVLMTTDFERGLRKSSCDFTARFCGHCNTTTDIKEANFFGAEGGYVVAGSDDGSFFVWEKDSTNLLRILKGDDSIVNCLQPHPSVCLLATSGIDPVVRLWNPQAEESEEYETESETEKGMRGVPDDEFAQVAKDNQRRMKTDPFEMMLLNLGYAASREGTTSDDSEGESENVPIQCHAS